MPPPTPLKLSKPSLHSLRAINARPLSPLLTSLSPASTPSPRNYGTTMTTEADSDQMPVSPTPASTDTRRPLLNAAIKLAVVFIVSSVLLGGTLYFAMPALDPADRPLLHLPRSFDDLKNLNWLLKKYKSLYPLRCIISFVVVYLFDQAFSLPGSMYLSILAGAVWGPWFAIPLCCACVATGASLCYLLSAALGPALLALPKWSERVNLWKHKLSTEQSNLFSFLIVLRIAPLPPHWVTNILCPHLGVGLGFFWITAFLGILAPTVIQVTIGGGLDEMTSPKDFHLLSARNVISLVVIAGAAMVPVVLRWAFKSQVEGVVEVEAQSEAPLSPRSPEVLAPYTDTPLSLPTSPVPTPRDGAEPIDSPKEGTGLLVLLKDDEDEFPLREEHEGGAGGVEMPIDQQGRKWGWGRLWGGKGRGVRL